MENFITRMKTAFGSRLCFIGLQGSCARKEETPESDIDAVVLLDQVGIEDLKKYKDELGKMPHRERICGFVSGRNEILHWEKSDLFHFYYDTAPLYGDLNFLKPFIQKDDVRRAVLIGACNLYHACSHNYIHENDPAILTDLYKGVFFVLRAVLFYEKGTFFRSRRELYEHLSQADRELMDFYEIRKKGSAHDPEEKTLLFEKMSGCLLDWSAHLIDQYTIDTGSP